MILPSTKVPTSGRRFPVVRTIDVVGAFEPLLEFDGFDERMGPAMLAQI